MRARDVLSARTARLADGLEFVWRIVVVIAVAFMATAVLWQVAARYLGLPSTAALVELVQYAFSIATFGGAAILFRRREHLAIGFLLDAVPPGLGRWLRWASDLITLALLALLVYLSFDFVASGMARSSPVLRIPVGWVFLVAGCALASGFLFALEASLRGASAASLKSGAARTTESTEYTRR